MENLTGRNFGPYEVRDELGQGGMAVVYRGFQPSMDREVAIKVLPPVLALDTTFGARFKQEAKVIASLEHARILPVYDYGEEDDITYLIMRLMEGGTLRDRILQEGPLSYDEAMQVLRQVAEGLQYAHSKGVIHRDVTSNNVMFDLSGNAYVTDFGMAKLIESHLQLTGQTIAGTPAYISPEQGLGEEVTIRADVYALGIVLYEMLVGDVPYSGGTAMVVVVKHINEPMPDPRLMLPDMPDAVADVILKATSKNPDNRYADCLEMADALTAAVTGKPVKKRAAPARKRKSNAEADRELFPWLDDPGLPVTAPQYPGADAITQSDMGQTTGGVPRWLIPVAIIAAILIVGAGIIAAIFLTNSADPFEFTEEPEIAEVEQSESESTGAQQPAPMQPTPPPTQPAGGGGPGPQTFAPTPSQQDDFLINCGSGLNLIAAYDFWEDETEIPYLNAIHIPPGVNAYLADDSLVIEPGQNASNFVQLNTGAPIIDPQIDIEVAWSDGPSTFFLYAFHVPDQNTFLALSLDTSGQMRIYQNQTTLAEIRVGTGLFDGETHFVSLSFERGLVIAEVDEDVYLEANVQGQLQPGFVSFGTVEQPVSLNYVTVCGQLGNAPQ